MLIQAAANEWKVPASECSAANSVITHKPSGRTTTYGKVADAAAKLEAPKGIKLKDPKDWKLIGKGVKRLDTADKLTGKQVYGIDIKMPGMLIATIKDSPVRTGTIKSFDAAKVMGMPGVKKVVQVGDSGVAVIADSFWRAHKALEALPIVWDPGAAGKVSSASIAEFLKGGLDAEQAFVGNRQGDVKPALAGAVRKVEAVYSYPYQNHATMEPMNMTALYTADKCEVWGPTQNGEAALAAVSEESGLPIGKCDVHKYLCGGGFGRRGRVDYVRQAVAIAKQMPGTPIKLIWSREEDMTHDGYHPITQAKLTAGIDAAGNVTGFHMRISGQSISASLAPERLDPSGMDPVVFQGLSPNSPEGNFGYQFQNILIDHAMRNTHILAGFWRGVNVNHNAIYTECFIDEVADALGQDKLAFRLKFLKPKHAAVLKAVADKVGWGTPAPQGVLSRARPIHGPRQLRGGVRRSVAQPARGAEAAPHRGGDRSGLRGQPGADRAAGGGLVRVRPLGAALRRNHHQGRRRGTNQFRHLQLAAHPRDAPCRGHRDAVGRLLGRRRRTDRVGGRARRAQRDLRGDGQALPQRAADA